MEDGFIGEIKMFGGNYAPRGWAFCDGRLLPVQDYSALYSILGTQFGGDGITNFALPDLRGRVAIGPGQGSGTGNYMQGMMGGYERITLTEHNLPAHNHTVSCDMQTGTRELSNEPENNVPAEITQGEGYGTQVGNNYMHSEMIGNTGMGNPIDNLQPFTCIYYIICLDGTYPPRD